MSGRIEPSVLRSSKHSSSFCLRRHWTWDRSAAPAACRAALSNVTPQWWSRIDHTMWRLRLTFGFIVSADVPSA